MTVYSLIAASSGGSRHEGDMKPVDPAAAMEGYEKK